MRKHLVLSRALAVVGTVLVWLPILAPLLLALASLVAGQGFRLDWLMPAELFVLVLGGGAILISVAVIHSYMRGVLIGSHLSAIAALLLAQGMAEVTGLASGTIEATGPPFYLVTALLAVSDLAIVVLGIGGIVLVRWLFARSSHMGSSAGTGPAASLPA